MDSAEWDERYLAADRLWSPEPNIFVESRLSGRQPGTGVELGCGEGRNAIWLAELGWKMTAVDFAPAAIERGRARSNLVEFVVADVLVWEPTHDFDLVLIAYLHLAEQEFRPMLERAVTWLRPGGELFMVGHDRSNIEHGHGGPQAPEILWDVDEISAWVEGATILEAAVVEREVPDEGHRRVARDALLRWQR